MKWITNNILWLMLSFVILGAALSISNAEAETNLYVGAWSKHLVTDGLNERHDLIAIEHNNWIAGTFDNSYDRETWFAARKWSWKHGDLEAGVYGGAMRGYSTCFGDDGSGSNVCPMVAPYITWHAGPVSPQVFLLGEAIAVSIKIAL